MALSTSKYRQDVTRKWLQCSEEIEVLCSRFDPRDPSFINLQTKMIAPVKKMIEKNLLPEKKDRELATRVAVTHCMYDWRTIVEPADIGDFGEVIRPAVYREHEIEEEPGVWTPFSVDNAVRIFMTYTALYYDVIDNAREVANFQLSDDERKNSPTV